MRIASQKNDTTRAVHDTESGFTSIVRILAISPYPLKLLPHKKTAYDITSGYIKNDSLLLYGPILIIVRNLLISAKLKLAILSDLHANMGVSQYASRRCEKTRNS